jgi:hypothetical protein
VLLCDAPQDFWFDFMLLAAPPVVLGFAAIA